MNRTAQVIEGAEVLCSAELVQTLRSAEKVQTLYSTEWRILYSAEVSHTV